MRIEKNVLRGALRAGLKSVKAEAKANVPREDGGLRRTIRISAKNQRGPFVKAFLKAGNANVHWASFVEYGTGGRYEGDGPKSSRAPFEIKAKPGKKLKFKSRQGNFVVTDSVMHPGARAKPYLRPALDRNAQTATRDFANYIRKRLPEELAKLKR